MEDVFLIVVTESRGMNQITHHYPPAAAVMQPHINQLPWAKHKACLVLAFCVFLERTLRENPKNTNNQWYTLWWARADDWLYQGWRVLREVW
ncbi:hypothetical protein FRC12_001233 [Ceratobasidium sp. 428]|nr:hypothetical protein FRC12_001233 [Ceratobasidium sp. 428]